MVENKARTCRTCGAEVHANVVFCDACRDKIRKVRAPQPGDWAAARFILYWVLLAASAALLIFAAHFGRDFRAASGGSGRMGAALWPVLLLSASLAAGAIILIHDYAPWLQKLAYAYLVIGFVTALAVML